MYLDESMRDLVEESYQLLEMSNVQSSMSNLHDYSFTVFPMAKAYEGFLKKVLLDMGLISKNQYYGEHFRIGRALNPNLPKRYRSGWVYERLVAACGSSSLPDEMWRAWKRARNKIFHFFPNHQEFISLGEAGELMGEIARAMEKVVAGCRLT